MDETTGPQEGLSWSPPTSGNRLEWDGAAVVKDFGSRVKNFETEAAVLDALSNLPVPRLLSREQLVLRMEFISGITGTEAAMNNMASSLLFELGLFLRKLHSVDIAPLLGKVPGEKGVLVHGDFAHYNCLMNEAGTKLRAVLDWETAFIGDPVLDLAWCEFQFRNSFPEHAWAVGNLFKGYGAEPEESVRQEAIRLRIEDLSRSVRGF